MIQEHKIIEIPDMSIPNDTVSSKPFFSIVVPVYNAEEHLVSCLESVLRQKASLELVIIDDGSTDGSPAICRDYMKRDTRVKFYQQENAGAASARNKGIAYSRGKYLLFVDSDDEIYQGSLIEIQVVLERQPVDVMFLDSEKVFPNGKIVPLGNGYSRIPPDSLQTDKAPLAKLIKFPASPWDKAIAAQLIKQDAQFQEGLLHEDLDWAMEIFLSMNSYGYHRGSYYRYHQRPLSASNSFSQNGVRDYLWFLQKWSEYRSADEQARSLVRRFITYEFVIFLAISYRAHRQGIPIDFRKVRGILNSPNVGCIYALTKKEKVAFCISRIFGLRIASFSMGCGMLLRNAVLGKLMNPCPDKPIARASASTTPSDILF